MNSRHARRSCKAKWGGAVVLEAYSGVREGAVTEGAGHPPVAGGVALGVQETWVHDAVEGQGGDFRPFKCEAEHM